jgi:hypothetical protein
LEVWLYGLNGLFITGIYGLLAGWWDSWFFVCLLALLIFGWFVDL